MDKNDPHKLVRELEHEEKELEERSESLEKEISEARQDWRGKRQAHEVGAPPLPDEQGPEAEEHGPEAHEQGPEGEEPDR